MRKAPFTLCVAGGGFTGAAIAIACLQRITEPFRLVMIEHIRRSVVVSPMAATTRCICSMRARDLSIRASQPGDFLNWAFHQLDQEKSAGLHEALAQPFCRGSCSANTCASAFTRAWRRDRTSSSASSTTRRNLASPRAAAIASVSSERAGNRRRAVSRHRLWAVVGVGRGRAEAIRERGSGPARRRKQIALIGSGLTMVDVLLAARRDGFHGTALVVSRRGQLPRPHAPRGRAERNWLAALKEISLLAAAIRISCEMAEESGTPWQAVIDGFAAVAPGHLASLAYR